MSRLLKQCEPHCFLCSDNARKMVHRVSQDSNPHASFKRPSLLNHSEDNCALCRDGSKPQCCDNRQGSLVSSMHENGIGSCTNRVTKETCLTSCSRMSKTFTKKCLPPKESAKLCPSKRGSTGKSESARDNSHVVKDTAAKEQQTVIKLPVHKGANGSSSPQQIGEDAGDSSDGSTCSYSISDSEQIIVLTVEENELAEGSDICPDEPQGQRQEEEVEADEQEAATSAASAAAERQTDVDDEKMADAVAAVVLTCDKCCVNFTSKKALERHVEFCSIQYPTLCFECKKLVSSEAALKYHLRCHRQEKASPVHVCGYCKKPFRIMRHLVAHCRGNPDCRLVRTLCHYCGHYCENQSDFEDHTNLHRNTTHPVMCDQCDELFTKRSVLLRHIQSAHAAEQYCCDHCGKLYSKKDHLARHLKGHGEPQYPCLDCGRKFVLQSHLRRHIKNHFREGSQ